MLRRLFGSSVSAREEVPLVMKMRRGSEDLSRRGTKVSVTMWVPVTFVSHDSFHPCRVVILPVLIVLSKLAPTRGELALSDAPGGAGTGKVLRTCVVDEHIDAAKLLFHRRESSRDRGVVA